MDTSVQFYKDNSKNTNTTKATKMKCRESLKFKSLLVMVIKQFVVAVKHSLFCFCLILNAIKI